MKITVNYYSVNGIISETKTGTFDDILLDAKTKAKKNETPFSLTQGKYIYSYTEDGKQIDRTKNENS